MDPTVCISQALGDADHTVLESRLLVARLMLEPNDVGHVPTQP